MCCKTHGQEVNGKDFLGRAALIVSRRGYEYRLLADGAPWVFEIWGLERRGRTFSLTVVCSSLRGTNVGGSRYQLKTNPRHLWELWTCSLFSHFGHGFPAVRRTDEIFRANKWSIFLFYSPQIYTTDNRILSFMNQSNNINNAYST